MSRAKAPKSLRANAVRNSVDEKLDGYSTRKVSAVAGLVAVASFSSGAEAQQSNLPPVSVDAPVARPKPAASAPTPDQVRARNALRRAAKRQQQQAARAGGGYSGSRAGSRSLCRPGSPYKGDHLQASGKFPNRF